MKKTALFLGVLLFAQVSCWGLAEAVGTPTATKNASIDLPFQFRSLPGKVAVSVTADRSPKEWGYDLIFHKRTPLDSVQGYPICIAKVSYAGKGYAAAMGWIQFLTFKGSEEAKFTVMLDHAPFQKDIKSPFIYWGPNPTLFDAPSWLLPDYSRRPGLNWRADSFLVASPDGVMTKSIVPIASFTWGYQTTQDGKVSVVNASATHLKDWPRFSDLLRKQFPGWTIH